jgi:multisubunit Na+/H+ antiporter MnhG subunit
MLTSFGDVEFENMLSNLSLTTAAVGAALVGILVLIGMFFAANPKSKAPVFAAIVTVIAAATLTMTGVAAYTSGISTPQKHSQEHK